ncbi:MAG: hypothetical protein ACTHK4_00725 [Mycobacteriales bacterium]
MIGRWRAVGVIAVLTTVLPMSGWPGATAGGSGGHGTPITRPAPARPPATSTSNSSCVVPDRDDSASPPQDPNAPLVWVHAAPTGMVAIWLPGLNAKHCVARRTVSGATLAGHVASAIRRAAAFPNGALPCPYSDGAAVEVYLRYDNQPDEYAVVTLNGCRAVGAPSRHARWSTTKLEHALGHAAPKAWARYFTN